MRIRITHVAWDYGVVNEAVSEVLKVPIETVQSKTTQTLCGRRVGPELIDNDNPICQKCIEELREAERLIKVMEGNHHGPDR